MPTVKWFGPNQCELCGKPAQPPNLIISKGHSYHIGCLADEFDRLTARYKEAIDRAAVNGQYGPWADNWDWKDARYMGENSLAEYAALGWANDPNNPTNRK